MTVEFPVATSPAPGVIGVDWETRVDFERLRQHRIARTRQLMEQEDLAASSSSRHRTSGMPPRLRSGTGRSTKARGMRW